MNFLGKHFSLAPLRILAFIFAIGCILFLSSRLSALPTARIAYDRCDDPRFYKVDSFDLSLCHLQVWTDFLISTERLNSSVTMTDRCDIHPFYDYDVRDCYGQIVISWAWWDLPKKNPDLQGPTRLDQEMPYCIRDIHQSEIRCAAGMQNMNDFETVGDFLYVIDREPTEYYWEDERQVFVRSFYLEEERQEMIFTSAETLPRLLVFNTQSGQLKAYLSLADLPSPDRSIFEKLGMR